jgi:DNA-binding transcriptional regulator YdaS (Cro superfamily)
MDKNGQKDSVLAQAIAKVGSQELFAARIGVSQQAVSKMLRRGVIPAEYVVLAEQATDGEITRQELRPDLFQSQSQQKQAP